MSDTLLPETAPEALQPTWVYAGFWRRFAATVLDCVFSIMLSFAYGLVIAIATGATTEETPIWVGLTGILVELAAIVSFWCIKGGTPGKLLMGLRLVDATTGEHLSVGRSLQRYFGYYISSIPLGLGYFWMCWDKNKQTWHDMMAQSVVIQIERPSKAAKYIPPA